MESHAVSWNLSLTYLPHQKGESKFSFSKNWLFIFIFNLCVHLCGGQKSMSRYLHLFSIEFLETGSPSEPGAHGLKRI